MVAIVATRLSELNNEISCYRTSCAWYYHRRTNSEDAGIYDVYAWRRTDYSRNTYSHICSLLSHAELFLDFIRW